MAIDERSRHRLYLRLEEVLGTEEATVLMEHLPPVGWADVATKRDVDLGLTQLEERMELRFQALEYKLMAAFESGLRAQARTFMFFTASFGVSLAGAVIAAAKLL